MMGALKRLERLYDSSKCSNGGDNADDGLPVPVKKRVHLDPDPPLHPVTLNLIHDHSIPVSEAQAVVLLSPAPCRMPFVRS